MCEGPTRRSFLKLAGSVPVGLAAGALLPAMPAFARPFDPPKEPAKGAPPAGAVGEPPPPKDAAEALARLVSGNGRFADGKLVHPGRRPEDFAQLAEGQAPFATIIGCADSRVGPEIVFDQGVGDLFVVRVAGNVVARAGASVKGSVEYSVGVLGVKLIMVLGHSQCGAIKAAIQYVKDGVAPPDAIGELVEGIAPAVKDSKGWPGDPLENAIVANVQRGVERVKRLGSLVTDALDKGRIKVVGATYDLKTGRIKLLDAAPSMSG